MVPAHHFRHETFRETTHDANKARNPLSHCDRLRASRKRLISATATLTYWHRIKESKIVSDLRKSALSLGKCGSSFTLPLPLNVSRLRGRLIPFRPEGGLRHLVKQLNSKECVLTHSCLSSFYRRSTSVASFVLLTQVCQTQGDRMELFDRAIDKSLVRSPHCGTVQTHLHRPLLNFALIGHHTLSPRAKRCTTRLCDTMHIELRVKIYLRTCNTWL